MRPPGPIVLFGSGETSPDAQRIHDFVMRRVAAPVRASVLETPAGFELNSAQVAQRLADYLRVHLQNYQPEVTQIPARRRGTAFSPDSPEVVAPLFESNYVVMGPGSPTYAIRQLAGSLAWHAIVARHRLGSPLVLASAATIAAGAYALPVYEIYKVGEDLHWKPGLNLLGPYGLSVAFVPHWDNNEGGEALDTSHCFMGRSRFAALREMLPPEVAVLGIEEHTALVLDFAADRGHVLGRGGVVLIKGRGDGQGTGAGDERGGERRFGPGEAFDLSVLGEICWPEPAAGLPEAVWQEALAAERRVAAAPVPPPEVLALVEARAAARSRRDWAAADGLRDDIARLGWQVKDTPAGPEVVPAPRRE